ncbi:hypothetical protein [Calidithermus chliarophilus]|uniref:hypothetical protein n=1 Tax=Calidithermus chliarophilus TaxID=52023 RepID=UPI00041E7140|nr:hypothetical protein [Calidithermus chliarophilus]
MNPRLRELGLEAARRTGIDFESYRKPELLERVNRLLAFVPYALSTVAAPAAVLLAGLLALTFWLPLHPAGSVLLFLAGLPLALTAGVALGTANLVRRFGDDLGGIARLSLELAQEILADAHALSLQARTAPDPADVAQGVLFVVVAPAVEQSLRARLGLLAAPAIWGLQRGWVGLGLALRRASSSPRPLPPQTAEPAVPEAPGLEQTPAYATLRNLQQAVETYTPVLARRIAAPAHLLFYASSTLGAFVLIAVYAVFAKPR